MSLRLRPGWICPSCRLTLHRSSRHIRQASTSTSAPPAPPSAGFTKLPSRRLVEVYGPDASHFLHGICTSAVPRTPPSPLGFYSAFLTAQGRVLYDAFVYPFAHSKTYRDSMPSKTRDKYGDNDPGYLIEVDSSQAADLMKHLKRYKLRAKVDIRALEESEVDVWSIWDEATEPWTPHPSPSSSSPDASSAARTSGGDAGRGVIPEVDLISLVDSRAPGMGRRLLLPGSSHSTSTIPEAALPLVSRDASATPSTSYNLRRFLKGVPEGPAEIPASAALPAEHNMDIMSGIDFRKGCYVGQELTIRTHHTGVVRKRILPVMLYPASSSASAPSSNADASGATPSPLHGLTYDPSATVTLPPTGADIKPYNRTGRSAGKFITGVGNIGLGLCRVEMMTDLVLTADGQSNFKPDDEFQLMWEGQEGGEGSGTLIKAFVPEWMRGKIKVRKPQQRI